MKFVTILLYIVIITILVLSIGKFFCWSFPLELLANFQVQSCWLLLTTGLVIAICWWDGKFDHRSILLLLLFTLALNLVDILPWYLSKQQIVTDRSTVLSVMSFNICVNNPETPAIVRSIRSVNPDLAIIIEVTPAMMENINVELKSEFPYSFRSPGGGLGIFSKLPLQSPKGEKFSGSSATNLVTTVEYEQRSIKIIGTHPMAPRRLDLFTGRNQHLDAIGNYFKDTKDTVILLGDFNLTPWSPYYRQLVKQTGLHNTRLGFGILPTWIRASTHVEFPSWLFPILNMPIDHIFVSKDLQVVRTYTGDNGNSDHAPIISELSID
jgi:endonuclease/exonuclease/phosphatase (EEP) superfamily protein YafD